MDYYVFFFEELNAKQRKTYITRTINNDYIKHMNNPAYYHLFKNKPDFLKTFHEYIKRDYVYLKECSYEEYLDFVGKHPIFMAKPVDGMCGKGIEVIDSKDKDLKALYDGFMSSGQQLLEERIAQNKEMSKMYPEAINTIRIVTCRKGEDVHILFRALRIGNEGRHVDNFNSGGMFTVIDEDGVIRKPAIDKDGNEFDVHPYTGCNIIGFKIPMYEQIIEQAKKMAFVVPEVPLVGWDFCVSEKGIDVVEGNEYPGYDIYQSKQHLEKDRIGLKKKFDDVIYS